MSLVCLWVWVPGVLLYRGLRWGAVFLSWTPGPVPGLVCAVGRAALAAAVVVAALVGIALGYYAAAPGGAPATTVTVPSATTLTKTSTTTVTKTAATTVTAVHTATVTATSTRIVLVDALGRTLVLERPAKRVVSLAPSITETICMMGLCSHLVGVDKYSLSVKGVPRNVTVVDGYWNPSPEKIVEAKPDLVLGCAGVPNQERMARLLEQEGLRVFFLRCDMAKTWNDIQWDVRAIGVLLGNKTAADRVIAWMNGGLANLSKELVNVTRPRVALLVWVQANGAWVAGGGTFQDTIISTAGGTNAFHNLYRWQMVSYEQLLAAKPDYIIAGTMGGRSAAEKMLETLKSTPLNNTKAFREGHVCVVYGDADNALNRPSPRAVLAAWLLAHILHPDRVAAPKGLEGYVCLGQARG